jgi:hypothetical protein
VDGAGYDLWVGVYDGVGCGVDICVFDEVDTTYFAGEGVV